MKGYLLDTNVRGGRLATLEEGFASLVTARSAERKALEIIPR